jgi:hypothetical protein
MSEMPAYFGAGIFGYLNAGDRLTIESSTISNNHAVGTWPIDV